MSRKRGYERRIQVIRALSAREHDKRRGGHRRRAEQKQKADTAWADALLEKLRRRSGHQVSDSDEPGGSPVITAAVPDRKKERKS